MLGNYYILSRIMREFALKAIGSKLEKVYSSEPNELCMSFASGLTLHIHALPGHSYLYFKEFDSALPKRNYSTFFDGIYGQRLNDVVISERDKHYTLNFDEASVEIRLYDQPNVFMAYNGVNETFKKVKDLVKKEHSSPEHPLLGNMLRKEFLFLEREPFIPDTGGAYIYTLPTTRILLSPIELQHIDIILCQRFDSANEAAKKVLFHRKKNDPLISKKAQFVSELTTYITRLEETIRQAEVHRYDNSRAERYQTIADALISVAHEYSNGISEIPLHLGNNTEMITLDPALSLFANAEKYYGKARHSRNSKNELAAKIDSFTNSLTTTRSMLQRVIHLTNDAEIDALIAEATRFGLLSQSQAKQASSAATFREFRIQGGYTLLVGKNAKQNDELTMHVAAKEDIWLHARHVSGSHAIIRCRSRTEIIPKETIIAAAEIAAYFSDAKSQKIAPVAYTKRKYVRKPRKALPGQVVVEKEEVVLVEPKRPSTEEKL